MANILMKAAKARRNHISGMSSVMKAEWHGEMA
jgi:hypothetical protein